MSYQQKSVTISLASYLLILGYYLVRVFRMFQDGGQVSSQLFGLWAIVIIATILVNILGNILANIVLSIVHAIRTRTGEVEPYIEDERDRLIGLKGSKVAYITFSIGVFLSMLAFAFGQPALVMFGLIILFSITAEIVGGISQIVLYQRGF
jgi:uncharacterized membrane protein